jgi:putative endonuclease
VYVLYSASRGVHYKGSCADVERRLADHNAGRVRSTKNGRPWVLHHCEAFGSKTEALRRERFLKTRSGYRWLRAQGLG